MSKSAAADPVSAAAVAAAVVASASSSVTVRVGVGAGGGGGGGSGAGAGAGGGVAKAVPRVHPAKPGRGEDIEERLYGSAQGPVHQRRVRKGLRKKRTTFLKRDQERRRVESKLAQLHGVMANLDAARDSILDSLAVLEVEDLALQGKYGPVENLWYSPPDAGASGLAPAQAATLRAALEQAIADDD